MIRHYIIIYYYKVKVGLQLSLIWRSTDWKSKTYGDQMQKIPNSYIYKPVKLIYKQIQQSRMPAQPISCS